MKNVRQIGIELHTSPLQIDADDLHATLFQLIRSLQKLHRLGFRLVSYVANGCVGKSADMVKRYYNYFDIVLYRP